AKATLTITSDAPSSPMSMAIQGTGEAASAAWKITPLSLTFPTVAIQTTSTLPASISNTGNAAVTISSVKFSNAVWTATGLSSGTTLNPGQQLNFQVVFRPTASGNVAGNLQVSSSSTSSVLTVNLSGAGSTTTPPPAQHTVTLNWNPSGSALAGYH